jgi:hypothetical protein
LQPHHIHPCAAPGDRDQDVETSVYLSTVSQDPAARLSELAAPGGFCALCASRNSTSFKFSSTNAYYQGVFIPERSKDHCATTTPVDTI